MVVRYQITEQLGEGGAGSVFKAWDTKLQRYVALKKLLPPEQRQAVGAGENLSAEAAALSALQHPHIVAVYDLDTDGPEQFVVMEFINGETLEATVRRGALLPEDFLQIAAEALDGLNAAHRQGMCHRDIKPSNLMFHWLPDGKWQTKLLDFGLANYGLRPAQQELAGAGTVAGSVHFMAPEQFLRQPLDVRSDLYSLGCVLYYALTGSFPCNGATMEEVMAAHLARQVTPLQSLRPDVNPLLTDWVMWLMSRQPEERPETATEALRVLRGLLSGEMKSLPVQRALKTQPVPGRTTVVASPLDRDAAARARAAETAGAVQTAPPAPPPPSAPPSAPARRVVPAKSAARRSSPAKPPGARPASKSNAPLIAGLAAAVFIVGAVIFFLTNGGGGKTGGGAGGDNTAAAMGAGEPPQEDLVIWFDAAQGALKDAGKSPAAPGDRVDQWDDRAVLFGNNPASYHRSATAPAERAKRYPTLQRVSDTGGLKGTHDVMSFDKGNNLVFARDRDKVGEPVARELSGRQLTWITVFSAAAVPGTQGLLCASAGGERRAWDSFVRDGSIYSGARRKGGAENHAALPLGAGKFHILAVVRDGAPGRLRQWLTGPDGRTAMSTATADTTDFGDVEYIRIGDMNRMPGNGGAQEFLHGGIACLLIYKRALDDAGRHAAVDYLARRYFGVPAERK